MVNESNERYQIVWLHEEQCHGVIVQFGAYGSLIKYNKDGMEYQTYFDSDDFTILDEIGFLHIEEDTDGQDTLL
jgi:hypothetical protein